MRARITYAFLAAAVAALAACAKQDQSTPAAAAAVAPAAPTVVTIHAKDFAYVAPDSIAAGYVTFNLVNDGTTLHHATIFRLDSGKTAADLDAALKHPGPIPAWAVALGGPNAPVPGATSDATVELSAGNYAMVCFVDVPGGVPHFMKGMLRAFVVTPSQTATAAPTVDDSITLKDYGFQFARALTTGHHAFAVTNAAAQPHEVEIVKLAPGKTGEDLVEWVQNPQGPPPGVAIGGLAFEAPGVTGYFSADFTAGNYLFICFVPDAKDGKPHFMHGMMHTETLN
ncbi:MAG TPA: hypothetical protein VNE60_12400 [Gemmatimonadaceae bacterium]|nr:hypothetical protein [Gemmatimonadaceae bacterium]